MDVLSAREARGRFADVIDSARTSGSPTLVTRHGRAAAVVVGPEWYEAHRGADDEPLPAEDDRPIPQAV